MVAIVGRVHAVGDDLTAMMLAGHAAALLPIVAVFFRYTDRTDAFQKSLAGTDSLLRALRQRIAANLAERLKAIFENPGRLASPIVGPRGDSYAERPANIVESEAYREVVKDFVDTDIDVIVAYRAVQAARDSWCRWARVISWAALLLLAWEIVALAVIGFVGKAGGVNLPRWLLWGSGVPTGLGVVVFLVAAALTARRHDDLLDHRRVHDEL